MVKWIADRMQELSFGQNMISKVTAAMTFANTVMLIGLYFQVDLKTYILPTVIIMIFLMWFIGWICEITGLRKKYREAEFKDVSWTKK